MYGLDHALKGPFTPLLDFWLLASLDGDQKIRIVLDSGLESVAVVLEKVKVDACATTGVLGVLNAGTVHVDEPSFSLLSGLEALEAHGFIDAVGEPCGL